MIETEKISRLSRQAQKSFLNMAGEFAVASELNRSSVLASVTYGTSKAADIIALSEDFGRVVRIQVKATDYKNKNKKWVLGQTVELPPMDGVFWVLVYFPEPGRPTDFFVLSNSEIHEIWREDHKKFCARFRERNGKEFAGPGVPTVRTDDVRILGCKNKWEKITDSLS